MTIARIYNGNLDSQAINRTNSLQGAIGFFVIFPDSTDELEIDFYLQVEVTNSENRLLKLNETYTVNTLSLYTIPMELQGTGLNIYGAIISTFSISIEVWAIYSNSTLEDIKDKLEEIDLKLQTDLAFEVAQTLNEIQQNIALTAIATGLLPITGGVSGGAIPALTAGSTLLLPFTAL